MRTTRPRRDEPDDPRTRHRARDQLLAALRTAVDVVGLTLLVLVGDAIWTVDLAKGLDPAVPVYWWSAQRLDDVALDWPEQAFGTAGFATPEEALADAHALLARRAEEDGA